MQRNSSSRLILEMLEPRNLPAGNVAAAVAGGVLTITGDNANNTISVESLGAGIVQVRGFGTNVNGAVNGLKTFAVTGDVTIRMQDGDDLVRVTNLVLPNDLILDLGDGNDQATTGQTLYANNNRFADTSAGPLYIAGDLHVLGGPQNDLVFQSDLHVTGRGTLELGTGVDKLHMLPATGHGEIVEYSGPLSVSPGVNDDNLNLIGLIARNDFTVQDTVGELHAALKQVDVQGNLSITTGDRLDLIDVRRTNVTGNFSLTTGANDDVLRLRVNAARINIDSGDGADNVQITNSRASVLAVILGSGNDLFELSGSTFNSLSVAGGTGNDRYRVRSTTATDAVFANAVGNDVFYDIVSSPNQFGSLTLNAITRVTDPY